MKTNKKAEGLSLTTIVVAALALLVLIVLSVIFVGKMARTQEKGKDCVLRGGVCYGIDTGATCKDHGANLITHPDAECLKTTPNADGSRDTDKTKICCIKAA
jgi:hypothetical protein